MRLLRACVALFAVMMCVAIAAGVPAAQHGGRTGAAKPPPPPPVARVMLTLNDGKTVSGEFVDVSPAGMTLKTAPTTEPALTPWSKIKHASNNMTHDGIVAEWQKSKRELLCDTCEGNGATTCPTCKGTSVDPAQATPCTKCSGTGSLGKCKTPNCVDGMIPCPDKCLKAESFVGAKDKDGKRWRQFNGKNKTNLRVSDAHVGQRVLVVDGVPSLEDKPCPTCGGTTRVKDPACKGTGKQICPDCKGHGVVGPDCPACDDGMAKCTTCDGTGLKPTAASAPPAAPTQEK